LAVVAVGLAITSLLIGAGGSAARPATTAMPTGPTVPWGFNEDWGWPAQGGWSLSLTTRHLKLAGAIMPDSLSANRFHVQWAKVESTPGTYNWTETDGQYAAMRKYTARPVMLLFNAPHWARDPGATCPSSLPCAYPPLTQYDSDWSEFVKAAVARYPEVRAIEVWNEPNLGRFWAPAPDPVRYATLLKLAHEAAISAGGTAPVLTGGLTPAANAATTMGAGEFLNQVYTYGCACDFEGIGAHPYVTQTPLVDNMTKRLDKLRAARDGFGDSATCLWITEIGLSSDGTSGVTLDTQGDELIKLYRSIEGRDVASFIIHRLHDIDGEGPYWNQTGVVDQNLNPKPAYNKLRSAIGGSSGPTTIAC
jgi:hypothetical protein